MEPFTAFVLGMACVTMIQQHIDITNQRKENREIKDSIKTLVDMEQEERQRS